MPIAAIVVCSVFKGALCHGPIFGDPLKKLEIDSKGKTFFRDNYVFGTKNKENRDRFKVKTFFWRSLCFWEEKLTKPGKIQSYKFYLYIFDQVSFRSSIESRNRFFIVFLNVTLALNWQPGT